MKLYKEKKNYCVENTLSRQPDRESIMRTNREFRQQFSPRSQSNKLFLKQSLLNSYPRNYKIGIASYDGGIEVFTAVWSVI